MTRAADTAPGAVELKACRCGEPRLVMKKMPTACERVPGGFIDASGRRWSKTPEGYRPNDQIWAEMQRDFD